MAEAWLAASDCPAMWSSFIGVTPATGAGCFRPAVTGLALVLADATATAAAVGLPKLALVIPFSS